MGSNPQNDSHLYVLDRNLTINLFKSSGISYGKSSWEPMKRALIPKTRKCPEEGILTGDYGFHIERPRLNKYKKMDQSSLSCEFRG